MNAHLTFALAKLLALAALIFWGCAADRLA